MRRSETVERGELEVGLMNEPERSCMWKGLLLGEKDVKQRV